MSTNTSMVYVLVAGEHDGSSHRVLRAYERLVDAEDAVALARDVDSRLKVDVVEVPLYDKEKC